MKILVVIFAFMLVNSPSLSTALETEPEFAKRFGHPLFAPIDSSESNSFDIWQLTPLERATLNLRNSADHFSKDIRFYYPDLVTPGREAVLSPLGAGVKWSKLLWNNRVWRDAHTNRTDLNLIPPMMIGSARSNSSGSLDHEIGIGLLQIRPLDAVSRQALTSLHHREGFYGFGPVEFIHVRPLTERSRISLGGYFPSSTGRFPPHSGYSGQTVWSRYKKGWNSGKDIAITAMDGLHKVESPYQTGRSDTHRNDLDVNFSANIFSLPFTTNLYRSETRYTLDTSKTYARDWGLGVTLGGADYRANFRAGKRYGILTGGADYSENEIATVCGVRHSVDELTLSAAVGLEGLLPDGIHPVGTFSASMPFQLLTTFLKFNQSVDLHSPEQRYSIFSPANREEPLEPMRMLYPGRPIIGHELPATEIRSGELGAVVPLSYGKAKGSLFAWKESNSAGWMTQGDSALIWASISDRAAEGWLVEYSHFQGDWRGNVSATGMNQHNFRAAYGVEPPYRVIWEIGKHKFYYNKAFETDFLLSGKYFGRFQSIAEPTGKMLGGGFPIDIRFTGRISRFTFHYGVHNLNSSRYSLVPGYEMMHKEEYWGIEWLLID